MIGSKGIVLLAWGKRGYGFMAHNLAVSLKHYSPSISIHLVATKKVISDVPLDVFDTIEYLQADPLNPGRFKASIYSMLPFDYNLYLDVDGLCTQPIEPLFDRLIDEGKHYYTFIHDRYTKESPEILPQMYWANRSVIWNHYSLNGHTLPASQSSIQFIKKCEQSKAMFDLMEECFDNPIPIAKLRNTWGGGQPDELYLNVAMALSETINHIGSNVIAFGNDKSLIPDKSASSHYIISYFGNSGNIKKKFWDYYDDLLSQMCAIRGRRHIYNNSLLKGDKIANIAQSQLQQRLETNQMLKIPTNEKQAGTIALFSSYYKTGDAVRQQEIDYVWKINSNLKHIDVIYNLGNPYDHPKVVNIDFERPLFSDFVKEMNKVEADYKILANSDIYFDHQIEKIKQLDYTSRCLALSRWDVMKNNKERHHAYEWSQDTWVFKGAIPEMNGIDFTMGLPACDNIFALKLAQMGLQPINPSRSIKTYHYHISGVKTYNEKMRLAGDRLPVFVEDESKYLKKKVLIIQPGRMGDIIICLPIAKWYFDKGFAVEWQCPKQYHNLFAGVDYCTPVLNPSGYYNNTIDISFGINVNAPVHSVWMKRRRSIDSFVSLKYELAGVPMSEFRKLVYNRNPAKELDLMCQVVHCYPYKLAHTESTYGGKINVKGDDVVYFKPIEGFSVLDWSLVIEKASEIHCIDSSLLNLVDSIPTDAKLFYYRLDQRAKDANETIMVKKWNNVKELERV